DGRKCFSPATGSVRVTTTACCEIMFGGKLLDAFGVVFCECTAVNRFDNAYILDDCGKGGGRYTTSSFFKWMGYIDKPALLLDLANSVLETLVRSYSLAKVQPNDFTFCGHNFFAHNDSIT